MVTNSKTRLPFSESSRVACLFVPVFIAIMGISTSIQIKHARDTVILPGRCCCPYTSYVLPSPPAPRACAPIHFEQPCVLVFTRPRLPQDFSDWPTIPQLYLDGEFVGGSDIVIELFQSGELQEMIEVAAAS